MAAELNITVEQGASWTRVCALQNVGATAYDLTGCTIEAQARGEFNTGSIPEAQFTVTYAADLTTGLFRLTLPWETTADQSFRKIMYWDILLTAANGAKLRILEGGVEVTAATTLPDVETAEPTPATPSGSDTVDITIVLTSPTSATIGTSLATDVNAVHYTADSGLTSGKQLIARTNIGAEAALGNPSTNGYVLSSTTAGVRSWIASGGGAGDVTEAGDNDFTGTNTFGGTLTIDTAGWLYMDGAGTLGYIGEDAGQMILGSDPVTPGPLINLATSTFSSGWQAETDFTIVLPAGAATNNADALFKSTGNVTYDPNGDATVGRLQFSRNLTGYDADPGNYLWRAFAWTINQDANGDGQGPSTSMEGAPRLGMTQQMEWHYVSAELSITSAIVSPDNAAHTRLNISGTVSSLNSSGLSAGQAICVRGVTGTNAAAYNLETLTVGKLHTTGLTYVDVVVNPSNLGGTTDLTSAKIYALLDEWFIASGSYRPFFLAWNSEGGTNSGSGKTGLLTLQVPLNVTLPTGYILKGGGAEKIATFSGQNSGQVNTILLKNSHASGGGVAIEMVNRSNTSWYLQNDFLNNGTDNFVIAGQGNKPRIFVDYDATAAASGFIGLNTRNPQKRLDVNDANGACLQLGYNSSNSAAATNYVTFDVSSSGDLTIAPSGGDVSITGNLAATALSGSGAGLTSVNAATVTVVDAAADTTTFPMLAGAATGDLASLTDAGLTYNASTNALTVSGLVNTLQITNPSTANSVSISLGKLFNSAASETADWEAKELASGWTLNGSALVSASTLAGGTLPGSFTTLAASATSTTANVKPILRQTFSNAAASVTAGNNVVAQTGTMSASRALTLPAANAVTAGERIFIVDESGTVTSTNTIVVTRAGSDTINGATTATISIAYGTCLLESDGSSKWTVAGNAGPGQFSSLTFAGNLGLSTGDVALRTDTSAGFTGVSLDSGSAVMFGPNANVTNVAVDLAIRRNAASILEINNGTAGVFAGLKASNIEASGTLAVTGTTTATAGVIFGTYTVGTFPTTTYLEAVVTDSLAPVVGATVAGGGSAKCKVMYNGSAAIVTAVL